MTAAQSSSVSALRAFERARERFLHPCAVAKEPVRVSDQSPRLGEPTLVGELGEHAECLLCDAERILRFHVRVGVQAHERVLDSAQRHQTRGQ